MDRTLYLSENEKLTVLRDGPSIWIKENGKAGRRVPARFVGRVVIIGNLRIESGVITLFTDNGIPVTFLNRRGDAIAVTIPYNHQLPGHYEEQKIFLDSDENMERFRSWVSARRREIQLTTIKSISKWTAGLFAINGFRERDYQKVIEEYRPSSVEKWEVVNTIISNLMREMIISCLIKADLDPHIGVIHRRHNFGLALDICHILSGEADIQCIQFLKKAEGEGLMVRERKEWLVSKDGMRDIIHRFENRKGRLIERAEKLLDEIFELMRELRK